MKQPWWILAIGILGGLLGAGVLLLVCGQPRGVPIELLPPPTAEPLTVHIAGAVNRPGLFSLPPGTRLQAAIDAAGGLLPDADVEDLNLAAPLADGIRVANPFRQPTPIPGTSVVHSGGAPQRTAQPAYPINLNTASQEDLESLPGIGPVTAQKILEYRSANGLFTTVEAIQDVPGIGPVTFENIRDLVTVGP